MSITRPEANTSLSDILYSFSLEKAVPDAELLDEYVRSYPEHAAALTDFAIELVVDAAPIEADTELKTTELTMSPIVSRAMSRFQNHLFAIKQATPAVHERRSMPQSEVVNPFAKLDRATFRDVAIRLHANSVFVAKLRDREIDPDTITEGFRRRIADELMVPPDVVIAHFAARSQMPQAQYYKANEKPTVGVRQSFQEAVQNAGLTDEQQLYLMKL
jgi:hypothetical protein